MGQVAISINGRNYQVACEDGQESHLIKLSHYIDQKLTELSKSVGQIGDSRLMLMTSLMIADELFESRMKLEKHESAAASADNSQFELTKVTHMLQKVSDRLTTLAKSTESA